MFDIAARRRVLFDIGTVPDAFTDERSASSEDGLEPARGSSDDGNGGNAFPMIAGLPTEPLDLEIECRKGGAISVPRTDGGPQMRWRKRGEDATMWRGFTWEMTYRFGMTTEVVAPRDTSGTGEENGHRALSGIVTPEGRIVIAVERRTNNAGTEEYAVDVYWRDSTATAFTQVLDVVSTTDGRKCPRIVRRPDGRLVIFYIRENNAGTGYQLASSFSTDNGESWSSLSTRASDVTNLPSTVNSLDVVQANGYYTAVTGVEGQNQYNVLYSVDGGVSFRQIRSVVVGSGTMISPRLLPLVDETLLFFWAEVDGADGVVYCTRLAAGLDYPETVPTIQTPIEVERFSGVADIDYLVPFRGYDGIPYIAIYRTSVTNPLIEVEIGTIDGLAWTGANSDPGLFNVMPADGDGTVKPRSGCIEVVPYQGTYALLWVNEGTPSTGQFSVDQYGVNWTPGAGNENLSVGYDWEFSWTMAAGEPSGSNAVDFTGTAGIVTRGTSPESIRIDGTGSASAYWSTTSTGSLALVLKNNADLSAVGTGVYKIDDGDCSSSQGDCVLSVRGSNGVISRQIILRMQHDDARLFDGDSGAQIGDAIQWDFTTWTEVHLAVRNGSGGAGSRDYAVRLRHWNAGRGDRVWSSVTTGTYVGGVSGSASFGEVAWGTTGSTLASGEGYNVIIGGWCLSQASTTWNSDGDGVFGTATERGRSMTVIPQLLTEGLYVAFSGDVVSTSDSFSAGTVYQYPWEAIAPGQRLYWRSASDQTDHDVVIDYEDRMMGRYDLIALWGTNFRKCKVQFGENADPFVTATEHELDATLEEGTLSGVVAPAGLLNVRNARVDGADWDDDMWTGFYFRIESGAAAGRVGIIRGNSSDVLYVETNGDTWNDTVASGATYSIFADRMFVFLSTPATMQRYVRIRVENQRVHGLKYRAEGFSIGRSHGFSTNWEWEAEEVHRPNVETVESPGGQRFVYDVGDTRREVRVEWTGALEGNRKALLGAWRRGGGGSAVCVVVMDTEGGPEAMFPARIVGEMGTRTQALYIETLTSSAPVRRVVDVGAFIFSEEIK